MKKLLILTSAVLLTSPAFSYYNPGTDDVRLYIGAGIAYSGTEYASTGEYADALKEFDEEYADLSINFGTKINKYFGIEAFILGSSPCELELSGPAYKYSYELSYGAFGANAVGYLPINDTFEFIASVGVAQYDFTHEYDNTEFGVRDNGDESSDETAFSFGIGMMFNINEHFSILGKYEYVGIDHKWFDTMSKFALGARYTF